MNKTEEMETISKQIQTCTSCDLSKTRTNAVVGDGSIHTNILFIGEAPGYNEDKQGKPFVGRAGKILDDLLQHIQLKREEVYIANILKCRPPKNRNPNKNEIQECTQYLDKQFEIIQPKILVLLGNFSYTYIFEKFGITKDKISTDHGKIFTKQTLYGDIYLIPMYHPAVATYNPNKIDILKKDFEELQSIYEKITMKTIG